MPPPCDKEKLQTLPGMITYPAEFAPQLSETTKPMRDLLKKDAEFIWDERQQTKDYRPRTTKDQGRYHKPANPRLLCPKEGSQARGGCQQVWTGSCHLPGRQTSSLRIKILDLSRAKLRTDRESAVRHPISLPQVPPVHLWPGDHRTLWLQATGEHHKEAPNSYTTKTTTYATPVTEVQPEDRTRPGKKHPSRRHSLKEVHPSWFCSLSRTLHALRLTNLELWFYECIM